MNKTRTLRKDQCGNIVQDSSLCDLWAHSPRWTFLIRTRRSAREWEWTLMFFRLKATFESNRVCLVNSLPTYNNRSFKQHIAWTRGCPCSCVICSTSALKVAWCMSIQAGLLQHCVYFYHSTSMWARCAAVMWPATRASRVRVALSLSTTIPQLKWLPTFTWGKRIVNFSAECDFGQVGSYLKILVHLMWSWRNEQINPCFSPSQKTARDKQFSDKLRVSLLYISNGYIKLFRDPLWVWSLYKYYKYNNYNVNVTCLNLIGMDNISAHLF